MEELDQHEFRWSDISAEITLSFEVQSTAGDSVSICEDVERNFEDHSNIETIQKISPTLKNTITHIIPTLAPYAHNQTQRPRLGSTSTQSRSEVLSPQRALLWLRSRLSTEDNEFNGTLLTVDWWQPVLMRVLPLRFNSNLLNYRLLSVPLTTHCNAVIWWRQISIKQPTIFQITQACGDYELVYLRTTDVGNAIDLKSRLRQGPSYHLFHILAIFPFAENIWEILINHKSAYQFKVCANACQGIKEENHHPGMLTEQPVGSTGRFDSCMRAQERLIARAVFAQLLARQGQDLQIQTASIYRNLVDLYRCYDAFENLYTIQPSLDTMGFAPGWSCVVGYSSYNSVDVGTMNALGMNNSGVFLDSPSIREMVERR